MMREINHQQALEAIQAQADGLLRGDALAALEHHLTGCVECRANQQDLSRLEKALRLTFENHARKVAAPPLAVEAILMSPKLRRPMMDIQRERRMIWAAVLIAAMLLAWLAGMQIWSSWPPDQILRFDKTRPAVMPTLAVYEPSPTPTVEPRAGGWHWGPSFFDNSAVETPRPAVFEK